MKYAIYFTGKDGLEDSINVESAKERDMNINEMRTREDFKSISFCKIYSNGEYGRIKEVI